MSDFRYRRAEAAVEELIQGGSLRPGDKLPSLRRMATRLGMSLTTISAAYLELEARGLIEARPRSGYYVRQAPRSLPAPRTPSMQAGPPRMVSKSGLITQVLEYNLGAMGGAMGVVPFGRACPAEEILPAKSISRLLARVLRERAEEVVRYDDVRGHVELRRQVAMRVADLGVAASPEQIVITGGAVEGLHIALRSLTRPGDTVLTAAPTYYCMLQMLESLGLRSVEIASCPERGVRPEAVAEALRKWDVKALVLTPNFNNPDGSLTPDEAKAEIVEICARHGASGVPIVEDDVYGDLYFAPPRPRTCKSFDRHGLVTLVSSFSKTVAPGWRVGWMIPGANLDACVLHKATTNVCSPAPTQVAMAEHLATGAHDKALARLRPTLLRQKQTLSQAIAERFPAGTRLSDPAGGVVLWLELPGEMDEVAYFYRALEQGVGVVPGSMFANREGFASCVRLSFGNPWGPQIEAGLNLLADLAHEMLAAGPGKPRSG